jgi:hypothetical protein
MTCGGAALAVSPAGKRRPCASGRVRGRDQANLSLGLLAGQAIRVCALYFFLRLGALALPPALAAAAGRFLSLAARSTISF